MRTKYYNTAMKLTPSLACFKNKIANPALLGNLYRIVLVIITVMKSVEPTLKNLDLRITRQRRVILDEFRKANTHLTADEVYNRVKKRVPKVSLGTIYRNLEVLSEHGFIEKIELAGHQKMFDGNLNKHYHMRCSNCQKLVDVPVDDVKIDVSEIEKSGEYTVVGYRLELVALCRKCSENK